MASFFGKAGLWSVSESFEREFGKNCAEEKAADVYAFALILWGMTTKKLPFADKRESEIPRLKTADTHEQFSSDFRLATRLLIQRCWDLPSERPKAFELPRKIRAIKADACTEQHLSVKTTASDKALSPQLNKSLPPISETVITVLPKKPLASVEKLFIRGSDAGLNWNHGVELTSNGDGTFSFRTSMPFTGKLEYKFLINDQIWEERPNRQIGQGKTRECIF